MTFKIFTTLGLLLLASNIYGQDEIPFKRNEFSAGIGFVSTSAILQVTSDVLATGLTGGNYSKDNVSWSGNFVFGYKFAPSKRFEIGFTYARTSSEGDVSFSSVPSGTVKTTYSTFAGEFQYNYVSKRLFKLYASVGLGYTPYTEKYTSNSGQTETNNASHFNFHVAPIGIKVGNFIGGFAEAGFGYKGIISAGVFLRL